MLFRWGRRGRRKDNKAVVLEALTQSRRALIAIRRSIALLESSSNPPVDMLKSLYVMESIMEAVIVRLETILVIGGAAGSLAIEPLRLVKEASRKLTSLPPELYGYLQEIETQLTSIAHVYEVEALTPSLRDKDLPGTKADEILREAEKAAEERLARRREGSPL